MFYFNIIAFNFLINLFVDVDGHYQPMLMILVSFSYRLDLEEGCFSVGFSVVFIEIDDCLFDIRLFFIWIIRFIVGSLLILRKVDGIL